MIRPNLRHLEIFLMLSETGSVSETARRMNLTQPAVSKAIAQFEDTTQLELFDRRRNRLHLTGAGLRLRDEAERLQNQVRLFSEEVDALQSARRGQITLVAIPALAFGALDAAATAFNQHYDQVQLALDVEMSRRVVEAVAQKRADLGFIHGASNNPNVTETYITDSEVMCLMHATHPLARLEQITPHDLDGVPLILFDSGSPPSSMIRESFAKCGVHPRTRVELNVSRLANTIVDRQDVAFVDPFSVVGDAGQVLRRFSPRVPLAIFMLTPKGQSASRIVAAFGEAAVAAIQARRRALHLDAPGAGG